MRCVIKNHKRKNKTLLKLQYVLTNKQLFFFTKKLTKFKRKENNLKQAFEKKKKLVQIQVILICHLKKRHI